MNVRGGLPRGDQAIDALVRPGRGDDPVNIELYKIILQTIASLTGIATTTGLFIAYRQFRLATRQSQTTFEDALSREYRQVAHRLPVRALLGDELPESRETLALDEFYWYFDLTNEQVFLRRTSRVTDATWTSWREGIATNLRKPAFARAWEEVKSRAPGSFRELRRLEDSSFRTDPRDWGQERSRPREARPEDARPAPELCIVAA
jgi:hypothetical protein